MEINQPVTPEETPPPENPPPSEDPLSPFIDPPPVKKPGGTWLQWALLGFFVAAGASYGYFRFFQNSKESDGNNDRNSTSVQTTAVPAAMEGSVTPINSVPLDAAGPGTGTATPSVTATDSTTPLSIGAVLSPGPSFYSSPSATDALSPSPVPTETPTPLIQENSGSFNPAIWTPTPAPPTPVTATPTT
jgi:hypothetical protein